MSWDLQDPATRARIRQFLLNPPAHVSKFELEQLDRDLQAYEEELTYARARTSFLAFCHLVYPGFKEGAFHRILAPKLEDIAFGRKRFLAVSLPPRHGKTDFISFLFAAWYMGIHAENKLMMATHTASLSELVGRRVRNLIDEDVYAKVFPATRLAADSKSAAAWGTTAGGTAYYTGVTASLAGRGAHIFLTDDPHNEQDALSGNPRAFDEAYEWYALAFQRLQDQGAFIVIHTRWSKRDLIGRILEAMEKNVDAAQYDYVELPMELPSGEPLYPERFSKDDIRLIKNTIPPHRWSAQYQQRPINADLALVPMDKWRRWESRTPPEVVYTMISVDSAIEANNRADFSVFGVFGVFVRNESQADEDGEEPEYQLILLDAVRDRLEYPDLKRAAIQLCEKWSPDVMVIEKKASGQQLLQDLRRMRLPVAPFEPGTKDKYARLQQVSDLFDDGVVWAPTGYRWAEDFITEVADFPGGTNDDCVDVLSQALTRFKSGTFAPRRLQWHNPRHDEDNHTERRKAFYNLRA